jgi:hypothetical protein
VPVNNRIPLFVTPDFGFRLFFNDFIAGAAVGSVALSFPQVVPRFGMAACIAIKMCAFFHQQLFQLTVEQFTWLL